MCRTPPSFENVGALLHMLTEMKKIRLLEEDAVLISQVNRGKHARREDIEKLVNLTNQELSRKNLQMDQHINTINDQRKRIAELEACLKDHDQDEATQARLLFNIESLSNAACADS